MTGQFPERRTAPETCSGGRIMTMSRRDVLATGTTAAMMAMGRPAPVAAAQPRAGGAKQTFDIIIVGGGSAGAVLAARLSADARRRVLLLAAGRDFYPAAHPPSLPDAHSAAAPPLALG